MLPDLPVLVLSMHDEMFYAERALRAGLALLLQPVVGRIPSETRRSVPISSFAPPTILQSMQAYHFRVRRIPTRTRPIRNNRSESS